MFPFRYPSTYPPTQRSTHSTHTINPFIYPFLYSTNLLYPPMFQSTYPSTSPFSHTQIYPSNFLSFQPSTYQSVKPTMNLSIHSPTHLSFYLPSIHHLFICYFVHLRIRLIKLIYPSIVNLLIHISFRDNSHAYIFWGINLSHFCSTLKTLNYNFPVLFNTIKECKTCLCQESTTLPHMQARQIRLGLDWSKQDVILC